MKIARLIACGLAALSIVGSTFALAAQEAQPADDSATQIATVEQPQHKDATSARHHHKEAATSVKVNLNTADAKALEGAVGAKNAEKIVAYRTKHGDFKSVKQLSKVLGRSYWKKNKTHLLEVLEVS